jgi:phage terminase large subunit GpA-like protein
MGARELPDDVIRAAALVDSLFAEFMRPPADLTVSQWADQNRMLSGKASSEPGPWRTDRTPYLRQIMDDLSARSTVQEVVVMFAAQLGKSETGNNWLGYIIDNEPGPVMIVQPTTDMAKRFSRQRITPMLEETPALRRKVRDNRSRDDANTTLMKDFAGGVLVVSGANSAASLRSMPVRYLFLDEIDAYPLDVDGEGDPVALAEKRTSTFARKKVLKVSTPTVRDFSRIESAFDTSDASHFHVDCPHCGAAQQLEWGTDKPHGLRWDRDDVGAPRLGTVRYVCAAHGCEILEHHKPAMLASGRWVASRESARPGKLTGYHLNALYAPLGWVSWADLVQQFTEAALAAKQGDISKLKTFTNTALAETWEEQGDKIATHDLARRAEDYALTTVPWGGLVITAGADVQGDRLEAYAWAVGRGNERWLVDHRVFYGDPSIPEDQPDSPWKQLTEWRRTPLSHASGAPLSIAATAVDSGGHHTQQVYHYARRHQVEHVIAIKGSSVAAKPVLGKPTDVEVNHKGQRIKRGARVWPVGTDTAKAIIYAELRVQQVGPGYVHFSRHTPSYVYDQLTAERLVTRYHKGRPKLEWLKPSGRRNEALDCAVYSRAAEHYLGIPKYATHHWARVEARLRQRDMLEATQAATNPLQLDKQAATIPAVAVEETPPNTKDAHAHPVSPPDTLPPPKPPAPQVAPARASRLPALPRKGRAGWIKRW